MSELKPCPFCGSEDIYLGEYLPETCSTYFFKVQCQSCWAAVEDQYNEREASAAWNNRQPSISVSELEELILGPLMDSLGNRDEGGLRNYPNWLWIGKRLEELYTKAKGGE